MVAHTQITYLDFTGLSNTNSLSNVAIGTTGETFNASITRPIGTAPDPTVNTNGQIVLKMNSQTSKQCLNLSFSVGAEVVIDNYDNSILNRKDSLTFDNTNYTLTDPNGDIAMTSSSGIAQMIPLAQIQGSSDWNIKFVTQDSLQICATRSKSATGSSNNNKLPLAIGVITSTLPIELLYFDAEVSKSNKVTFYWQTASEINNNYFTIERSIDSENWHSLHEINGTGNSSSLVNYTSTDKNPHLGVSYYRLKQTDFDGGFSYSKIKSINIDNNENSNIITYPNPTENQIIVKGNLQELEQIKIYNVFGQDVTNHTKIINGSKSSLEIDLSNLSDGIYYIKTKTTTNKVYKQ